LPKVNANTLSAEISTCSSDKTLSTNFSIGGGPQTTNCTSLSLIFWIRGETGKGGRGDKGDSDGDEKFDADEIEGADEIDNDADDNGDTVDNECTNDVIRSTGIYFEFMRG